MLLPLSTPTLILLLSAIIINHNDNHIISYYLRHHRDQQHSDDDLCCETAPGIFSTKEPTSRKGASAISILGQKKVESTSNNMYLQPKSSC